MPSIPEPVLHAKLHAALPAGTTFVQGTSIHPAELTIPEVGPVRIYLWTITHIESDDRPPDEYKIQLILPGQDRNARGTLAIRDMPTFLLGYSPDFGVFVGWEARLHEEFAFSSAKQIRESTLEDGRRAGWAVAPLRTLRTGQEVRVVFSPANLMHYIRESIRLDSAGCVGVEREASMLTATPNFDPGDIAPGAPPATSVRRMRRKLLVARSERDARFGPLVKKEYASSCAICGLQLGIIEGAHIIPACVEHSTDEVWNGIALCANHHKLFDASALIVTPELAIQVDESAVAYFQEARIDRRMTETLTSFHNEMIRAPAFYEVNAQLRDRMSEALEWRSQMSAFGA